VLAVMSGHLDCKGSQGRACLVMAGVQELCWAALLHQASSLVPPPWCTVPRSLQLQSTAHSHTDTTIVAVVADTAPTACSVTEAGALLYPHHRQRSSTTRSATCQWALLPAVAAQQPSLVHSRCGHRTNAAPNNLSPLAFTQGLGQPRCAEPLPAHWCCTAWEEP
jgi:hypothetical protein